MNLRQAISNYIGTLPGISLSKGHQIKTDQRIHDVYKSSDNRVFTALIDKGKTNELEISLFFDESDRKLISDCNCYAEKDCIHSAALALYLLDNAQNVQEVSEHPDRNQFISRDANEYRIIHKPEELSWHEFLIDLRPPSYYNVLETIEGKLGTNNHAYVQVREKFGDEQMVQADIEEDNISIICHDCNEKTNRLCSHQYCALNGILNHPRLQNWITGDLDYEEIESGFASEIGTDIENFRENFIITFDNQKLELFADDGVIFKPSVSNKILKTTSIESFEDEDDHLEYWDDLSKMGHAFAWYGFNQKDTRGFGFLQGKKNKAGTKIINSFRAIDYPFLFNDDQKKIANELIFMYQNSIHGIKNYQSHVLEFLQINKLRINQCRHFIYMDRIFPEHDKKFVTINKIAGERIKKSILQQVNFVTNSCRYAFVTKIVGSFLLIEFTLIVDDQIVDKEVDFITPYFSVIGKKALVHENLLYHNHAMIANYFKKLYVKKKDAYAAVDMLLAMQNNYEIIWDEKFNFTFVPVSEGKKELYIDERGNQITIEPHIKYDKVDFNILDNSSKRIQNYIYQINEHEKQDFLEVLKDFHHKLTPERTSFDFFYLDYQDLMEGMWFLEFFEKCKVLGITVYGQENLGKLKFNNSIPKVSTSLRSNQNWFSVDVDMKFGDISVDMKSWVNAIRRKSKYVRLSDGSLGILPEHWYKRLRKIYELSFEEKDELAISTLNFNQIEEVFETDEIEENELFQELQEKKQRLATFEYENTYKVPTILKAELRPYQWIGFQWLKFLDDYNMGGILADEMGLGKTVQVIALLAHFKEENIDGTTLVVVPRSLLFNWIDELERFSPELNAMIHHGTNRDNTTEEFDQFDIIITTYDTAVQDQKMLRNFEFHYIILDESQAIKNPSTKRYRAVTSFTAKNRLAMTGTPIENNTFDLYAQFSFVNPGIFGNMAHFKDTYSVPIDQQNDESVAIRLRTITAPYILRRTKSEVAKDLPDKTESIIYCELLPQQRVMYEAVRQRIRQDLSKTEDPNSQEKKDTFIAIEGLLRLRQICNSPYLLDKTLPPFKRESGKLNSLIDVLQNELGTSSALVFSQFTSMLDLIRKELDERKIRYAYLDGSTKNRKEVVEKFQNDNSIQIFLISLKAGNTGLNLTKAEYVYIVDPWWNPAVEAQAIDRTHRIGQDKHIFAYRLICKDTVEEKIVQLQKRKKKVASDLIHSEEDLFKSLKKEDLLALFES